MGSFGVRTTQAWRSILLVVMLAAVAWPSQPVQSTHGQLDAPAAGTVVVLDNGYRDLNLTFGEPEQRLTGYHEWRDVVPVQVTNAATNHHDHSIVFDLVTGLSLGYRHQFEHEIPILTSALPTTIDHDSIGGSIGLSWFLPESVLWGRYLSPGDSWEISTLEPGLGPSTTHVRVLEDVQYPDVAVQIETHYDDLRGRQVTYTWDLAFDWFSEVVATHRLFTTTVVSGNDTSTWAVEHPANVAETGTDPLPFQGRGSESFVAGPDRQMTFGDVGVVPEDPDPHPAFNISRGAEAAWNADLEEVRAYRSRAEDPYVVRARAGSTNGVADHASWSITFQEAGGRLLSVSFGAVDVAGQPLVWTQGQAFTGQADADSYLDPTARAAISTVHPGAYARYFDAFAAERGRQVESYEWNLQSWTAHPHAIVGGTYGRPTDHLYHNCDLRVSADGSTGVVLRHTNTDWETYPGVYCEHDYLVA